MIWHELNEIQYAAEELYATLWFAGCWLHDILEHYERKVEGEWPYEHSDDTSKRQDYQEMLYT